MVVSSFVPPMSGSLMSSNARLKNLAFDFVMASFPFLRCLFCIPFAGVWCLWFRVCLRRLQL